jgi:hypothetical protein
VPRIPPNVAPVPGILLGTALPALLWLLLSTVPAAAEDAPAAAARDQKAATATQQADAPKVGQEDPAALAKRYGYTVVKQDGETLYCKTQRATGSRVQKQRRCVTEEQMELEATNASEVLDKVNKGFTPQDAAGGGG